MGDLVKLMTVDAEIFMFIWIRVQMLWRLDSLSWDVLFGEIEKSRKFFSLANTPSFSHTSDTSLTLSAGCDGILLNVFPKN